MNLLLDHIPAPIGFFLNQVDPYLIINLFEGSFMMFYVLVMINERLIIDFFPFVIPLILLNLNYRLLYSLNLISNEL